MDFGIILIIYPVRLCTTIIFPFFKNQQSLSLSLYIYIYIYIYWNIWVVWALIWLFWGGSHLQQQTCIPVFSRGRPVDTEAIWGGLWASISVGAGCVGETIRGLEVKEKLHVSRKLLKRLQNATSKSSLLQESVIGDHLADHYIYRTNYPDDCLSYTKRSLNNVLPFRGYSNFAISLYFVLTEKAIWHSLSVWGKWVGIVGFIFFKLYLPLGFNILTF